MQAALLVLAGMDVGGAAAISAQTLLREADAQLYTASSRGRHQASGGELPAL